MKCKQYLYTLLSVLILLSACTVGPDFVKPAAPPVKYYSTKNDPISTQPISSTWWKSFHSTTLDQIVQQGIHDNYTLASMRETLKQAKEITNATRGQLLPQTSFSGDAGRQKYGVALFGPAEFTIPTFSYYTLGPSLSWAIDLFGKTQKTIEQNKAIETYQQEMLKADFLTLTGNIVTTTFEISAINDQITQLKNIIQLDQKTLILMQKAWKLGKATRLDIINLENQQTIDNSYLPLLYQQKNTAHSELNILLGAFPANWQPPALKLAYFTMPRTLPLTLPSQLIHDRPDILAAEALLHAASANIGIATANLYPQITLSANSLQEALEPYKLFNAGSNASSILGGITVPLFNGGTLQAEKRAAIHAYKAAYANYQQVVIQAFTQVGNILKALQYDEQAINAQAQAVHLAQQKWHLSQLSYQAGNASQFDVLIEQRAYLQTKSAYIQSIAQKYQDITQLYLVLGGGTHSQH